MISFHIGTTGSVTFKPLIGCRIQWTNVHGEPVGNARIVDITPQVWTVREWHWWDWLIPAWAVRLAVMLCEMEELI